MTTQPTPPIELSATDGVRGRWPTEPLPDTVLRALVERLPDDGRPDDVRRGQPRLVAARPALVARRRGARSAPRWSCRPTSTAEVVGGRRPSATTHHVPLTVAGGRSGVTGASVPAFGGVVLDITGLAGHRRRRRDVGRRRGASPGRSDPTSSASCTPSTRSASATSRRASTSRRSAAGSRAAAPASTRPATARSRTMVVGLEVVLADGRVVRTGGAPAAAVGPDLTQLFIGSEGTLGIVTRVWLRTHRRPARRPPGGVPVRLVRRRRRGLPQDPARAAPRRPCCACTTPSSRRVGPRRRRHPLHAARARRGRPADRRRDDGRRRPSSATLRRSPAPATLVDAWLEHRNDTSALQALTRKGFVVDTMEIAAPWSRLAGAVRRGPRRAARRAHDAGRQLPPVAQLPRRRLPLLHVRRRPAGRRGRGHLRGVVGRRPARRARRRRQPLAPPRRRAQPLPVRGRGPRRRRRRARRGQGRRSTRTASSTRASSVCPSPFGDPPWPPDERRGTGRWDWDAIRAGAGVALVFAVPFSIAARWAADADDSSSLAVWLSLGAVVGFVLGAGCAAWVQRAGTPLTHGIVTAVGHLRRRPGRVRRSSAWSAASDVHWFAIFFNLSVVARRRPRRRPARPAPAPTRVRARPRTTTGAIVSTSPDDAPVSTVARDRRRHDAAARRHRRRRPSPSSTSSAGRFPPTRRSRAWSSSTPQRWPPRRSTRPGRCWPAPPARSPPSASPTSGPATVVWDRATGEPIGPALGWQDLRTVGECIVAKAEHGLSRWRRTSRPPSWRGCSPTPPAPADRDLALRHRSTRGWRGGCPAARSTSPTTSNAAITGLLRARRVGVERRRRCDCSASRCRCCRALVPTSGVVGEATRAPGRARRSPPSCGDQQASLVGQGCVTPGSGQDHVRHRRDARRLHRPGSAGVGAPRCDHGSFPIVAWSHRRGEACTWGVEAIMLVRRHEHRVAPRRPRPDRRPRRATSAGGHASPAPTGSCFVPALLGLGTPQWDYGARGTLLGITRGSTRAHVVRAVLEGVAHRGADLVEATEADTGCDDRDDPRRRRDEHQPDVRPGPGRRRPVVRSRCPRSSRRPPRGAAFLAGLAVGVWDDAGQAAALWRPARRVEPSPDLAALREFSRAKWHDAVGRASGWIPELSALEF